jgi:PAS domain S-box-containing protein
MKIQPDPAHAENLPFHWDGKRTSLPNILLDAAPFMIWVKDVDGHYVFINEAYRQFFSVNDNQRIGLSDWEIYPPALASQYRSEDDQVCRQHMPLVIRDHYPATGKKNETYYETIKRPLLSATGQITGVYATSQNITARVLRDDKLARQKRLLEALHQMSMELISKRDIQDLLHTLLHRSAKTLCAPVGFLEMVNEQKTGMEMQHYFGDDCFVPPSYLLQPGQGLVGQVWASGKVLLIDDYQQWNGRLHYPCFKTIHAIICMPIFSRSEIVGAVTLCHTDPILRFDDTDIAALEQFSALASVALENARLFETAAQELQQRRESENLYRALVDQSADIILLFDPVSRRLLQANKRYLELTGYTEAEIRDFTAYDVVVDDRRWIDHYFDVILPQRLSRPPEMRRFRRKDGSLFDMERSITLVSLSGRDVAMSVSRDVSERRHTRLMEFLHETTLDIVGHLDQADLLKAIVKRAVDLVEAPFGYCALLDPVSGELEVITVAGIDAGQFKDPPRANAGLAAKVLASGKAMVVDDYRNWPDRLPGALFDRITSMAIFPLKNAHSEVVGLLTILHWDSDKRIRLDDFSCLEEIANLASLALDNARLYNTARVELASRAEIELQVRQTLEKLDETYDTTLEGWARALDLRDCETEGHSRRVASIAVEMAKRMNIPAEQHIHIWRGALLHDIGKLGVPDSILLKPGPLTAEEWQIMRLHPVYGYDWLHQIEYLHPALAIPRSHHERWDGEGYPDKLCGETIPLEARIFAPIDVWDALSSNRPYRRSWPDSKIREHIRALSGSHFDPAVVEIFLTLPPTAFAIRAKPPETK